MTIAGASLAVIGVAAAGFVLGRSTSEAPPPLPVAAPPQPTPSPATVLPTVQPPLNRADLLAAAAQAADAAAAGEPLPEQVAALAGRPFELRLPFGCPGAEQPGRGALSMSYDPETEVLRVRAEPVRWDPGEWLAPPPAVPDRASPVETIEGFWIARAWTSSEACAPPVSPPPSAAPSPQPSPTPASVPSQPSGPRSTPPVAEPEPEPVPVSAAAPERTLAIAQLFTAEASRVGRRNGQAYAATKSIAPDAMDLGRGLRLRLRGTLARTQAAGPILCLAPGGARPVCLISARFDQVAIENPVSGETLATWDVATQDRAPGGRQRETANEAPSAAPSR